jgi:gamma-glutamyltranspeptidase/glutathione hydrolase
MVATAHYEATAAATSVLREGGNAVDAAVTAAFALGVCEASASGLGGQTMALIYLKDKKKTIALDGSSRAPHRVVPGKLEQKELLRGHRAATVPSTPAVLGYLLDTYGTLPLSRVLEPSIELAEIGFKITELNHDLVMREKKHLRAGSASIFFLKNGKAYPLGAVFRQPVLAATLRRLAGEGIEDFYQGEIACKIHEDMEANGGFIRDDDLAQIP